MSALKRYELPFLLLLLLGAAALRFVNLSTLPGGFHGDEAIVGLEAQRILREGFIGPYSPLAQGQPSGPLYLTALSLHLFGSTIWAVRAVSALCGTLTVLLLYVLLRRHRGRTVAMVGAIILATLHWHIHFSRLGFPVIVWPLCALATTFVFLEAVQRQQKRWWVATGLATGIGIYSYNAHILFICVVALWLLCHLIRGCEVALERRATWLLCFVAALVVVALPMLRYASNPANDYFSHARGVSLWGAPKELWPRGENVSIWPTNESSLSKTKFIIGRTIGFWDNLSWHSQIDTVDGGGVVPVVPLGTLLLVGLGIWFSRRDLYGDLVGITLCSLLLLPLGSILTVNGFTRRALALAPFLAILAAIGLVELWKSVCAYNDRKSLKEKRSRIYIARSGIVLFCGFLVWQDLTDYFERFASSPVRAWVFCQDFADTCAFLRTIPPDSHILFYSDRWSCNYEPRLFLAPNAIIEDRSSQFGVFSFDVKPKTTRPTFVLMGSYISRAKEIQKIYPRNRVQIGPPSAETGLPAFLTIYPLP